MVFLDEKTFPVDPCKITVRLVDSYFDVKSDFAVNGGAERTTDFFETVRMDRIRKLGKTDVGKSGNAFLP